MIHNLFDYDIHVQVEKLKTCANLPVWPCPVARLLRRGTIPLPPPQKKAKQLIMELK